MINPMSIQPFARSIAAFSIVTVLLLGCTTASVPFENIELPESDLLSFLTVRASEMTCAGCVYAVSTAIEGVPGVIAVDGDIATKEIFIIYDSTLVSSDTLVAHPIFDNYGRKFISDEPYSS